MPIRPHLREFYRGPAWAETRRRILKRAGNCCEQCHVPNSEVIARVDSHPGWWFTLDGEAHDAAGELRGMFRGSELTPDRFVTIVLTIAHLNHTPGDDRDENLKALCQRCHLVHDKGHHKETRTDRKDSRRPLLEAL